MTVDAEHDMYHRFTRKSSGLAMKEHVSLSQKANSLFFECAYLHNYMR